MRRTTIRSSELELCPRCGKQGYLRRVDQPGTPWRWKRVCGTCELHCIYEGKAACRQEAERRRAAMSEAELRAQARKDIADLYG
jgi:hypothetical protein